MPTARNVLLTDFFMDASTEMKKNAQTPRVSVVTPVYNGAAHISCAIASIRQQTLGDFEMIVVDDSSTDGTLKLVEALSQADDRIRLVRHETNKGCAQAYNTAFAHARGRYIVVLDHDDVACPDRLEKSVGYLEAHPELDGCGAAHAVLSENRLVNVWNRGLRRLRAQALNPDQVGAFTLFGGVLYNPTMCLRRAVLARVPVWHDPALPSGSDDDWFERLLAAGARMAILSDVLTLYRRRPNSNSRSNHEFGREMRTRIARRAVSRIVPDAAAEELALHDRLVLRDRSLGPEDEAALRAWFIRLLTCGTPQWGEGLRYVLGRNWQRYCAILARHDVPAALRIHQSFPELGPSVGSRWMLLYQAQKRLLHS